MLTEVIEENVEGNSSYSELSFDQIRKEGWLQKQGQTINSWKKRWFVLQNGQLLYYTSDVKLFSLNSINFFFWGEI